MRNIFPLASALLLISTPAFGQETGHAPEPPALPPAVRQMITDAIASGNQDDIDTVARLAQKSYPAAQAEIAAMVNAHVERQKAEHVERIEQASLFQLWTGKVELGGFRSTGSTSEIGISAGVALQRTGLKWSHSLSGSADYRRANGETSRERFIAAYQPRYQFGPDGFIYGLTQFERDPIIGFDSRYTGSAGIGYKLIQTKKIDFSVDAGPSVRHVEYVDGSGETKLGARSSLDFAWKFRPTLTLRQTASGYIENDVRSLTAQTSLNSRLISRLSMNLSYNIQYETKTPLTDERLDTLSKATLVYDF
jgi:putative salt-induced outer membrane protein